MLIFSKPILDVRKPELRTPYLNYRYDILYGVWSFVIVVKRVSNEVFRPLQLVNSCSTSPT